MGRAILSCASELKDFEIVAALESPRHPAIGKTVSDACGIAGCDVRLRSDVPLLPNKNAVLVEFTSPEATVAHLKWARNAGVPVVIGTTGLDDSQVAEIHKTAKVLPIVFASNMSVGVNLLFKLVRVASSILGSDYDVEIFEVHHRFKKDAPSGTARRIAEIVALERGLDTEKSIVCGRKGFVGERKRNEIGIHSLRAGDVVGEHTVVFAALGERIELTHRAHSRSTFAHGALRAARFVYENPPGLYDMQDVLGIN